MILAPPPASLCNPLLKCTVFRSIIPAQHSTSRNPNTSLPQHKVATVCTLSAEAQLTPEASDVLADIRRNYSFRPSSHENILQSKDASNISPNTSRVRLRPKSRKGISHQSEVIQQHRVDRVLETERRLSVQLPCQEGTERRQGHQRQRESEGYHEESSFLGTRSKTGLEYSPDFCSYRSWTCSATQIPTLKLSDRLWRCH